MILIQSDDFWKIFEKKPLQTIKFLMNFGIVYQVKSREWISALAKKARFHKIEEFITTPIDR